MHRILSCLFAFTALGLSGILLADEEGASDEGMTARQTAKSYLQKQGDEGIAFRSLIVDKLGQAHIRYDQTHNGIQVFAGQTIVHVKMDEDEVIGITDGRRRIGSINTAPSISAKSAERRLKKAQGLRGRLEAETQLVIYVADEITHLAWHVNLLGLDQQGLPVDWIALVDAHNSEMLLSYDNLHTRREDPPGHIEDEDPDMDSEASIGEANTLYSGTINLATEEYADGDFGMRDPTRAESYTTDMLDKRTGDGELFIDIDNLWGNFTNDDRATVGADAHFGAALTWDYYLQTHGREGVDINNDGEGETLLSRVHFGKDYVNAYWSSACGCVTYGDGDGVTAGPLVSIDIVAHEITHGVTSATANLIYNGESGGLNESMSDIFATAVEFYAAGMTDTIPDYWAGEDVWTPAIADDALRYLDDPERDGRSIDHYDDYTTGMDVHLSSGIANHVFYLMSEGGPHASTSEVVTAIGRDKAEQVFYRALSVYMLPDTDFAGAREATMQAAADLYGSETAQLVGDAWAACGVN